LPVDHYENFPVASWLLPARLRAPVEAIYAFARSADDFADEGDLPDTQRLALLADYDERLEAIAAGRDPGTDLFRRLAAIRAEHELPLPLFHDLVSAFRQDVTKKRYANIGELMDYCHRSADPVGRLLLQLFRAASPANLAHSDAICTSLQLINHWQDVGVDWKKGRVYLPQEDLATHGVSEAQLAAGTVDGAWKKLMAFECRRARTLMLSGAPLGRALPGRMGLEIRAIVAGGLAILAKIEAAEGDVFRHRPVLRRFDWVKIVLKALR
jgi:squalene synthase HpnC